MLQMRAARHRQVAHTPPGLMLLITKMNHLSNTEDMSPETHKVLLDFLPFGVGVSFTAILYSHTKWQEGTTDIWVKVI